MSIIHALLRWVLGMFAPGTGRRRAGARPALTPSPLPEVRGPDALRTPTPRSPYGLDQGPFDGAASPSSAPTSSPSSGSRRGSPGDDSR